MMRHHLHMPSYFLGTFTEYPELSERFRKKMIFIEAVDPKEL